MVEVTVRIPNELNELALIKKINWQILIARSIKKEIEELAKIKRIVSESNLTENRAEELADETNLSLAKRYRKLLK